MTGGKKQRIYEIISIYINYFKKIKWTGSWMIWIPSLNKTHIINYKIEEKKTFRQY